MSLRLVSTNRFPIDDDCLAELRKRGIPLTVENYALVDGLEVVEGEHAAYIDRLVRLGLLVDDRVRPTRRARR